MSYPRIWTFVRRSRRADYVAILAGIGLQLEKHRQGPGRLSLRLERLGQLIEQCTPGVRVGCRRFGRTLEPFNRLRRCISLQVEAGEH